MESEEAGKITISVYAYHEDWLDDLRGKIPLPRSTYLQVVIWLLNKGETQISRVFNSPNFEQVLERMYKEGSEHLHTKKGKLKKFEEVAAGEV